MSEGGRGRWLQARALRWAERQALKRASGGRVDERPGSVQDAARLGAGVALARPLLLVALWGAGLAMLGALLFWLGAAGAVRGALEGSPLGGWVADEAGGEGGSPVAVGLSLLVLVAALTVALMLAGRRAVGAWDARRVGRRALATRLMLAPAAGAFGVPLALVAALVAGGHDRGGDGLFWVGPVLGTLGLLVAVGLLWAGAWVRTLPLLRLPARRGAAEVGAPAGSGSPEAGPPS